MRAKIIQYNGNDGSGLLAADNGQFDFSIRQWQGTVAPTLNRVVDVELDGDTVRSVVAVSDEVLLREKANALKEKLGGAGNLLGNSGGDIGKNILTQAGMPLAAAYGVFFVASLMFNFGSIKAMGANTGMSLYDMVSFYSQNGKGSYALMLYGAYASILIPVFLKHRFAPLLTLLPALMLLGFTWTIFGEYTNTNEVYIREMNSLWGGRRATQPLYPSFSAFFSFGLGFYISMAAATVAGWLGIRKFLAS